MERLTVAECEQVGWLAYEYCMRHYDQSRSQFTTFLQLKTRCLCLNILRDEHRHRKWEFNNIGGECFSILRVGGEPLVKLEDVADESEPDFEEYLDGLSPIEQHVCRRRFRDNYFLTEISREQGMKPLQVKEILLNVLEKIRSDIND